MIFGRTDLRISLSRAKFDEEADFEVRSALDHQKAGLFGEVFEEPRPNGPQNLRRQILL